MKKSAAFDSSNRSRKNSLNRIQKWLQPHFFVNKAFHTHFIKSSKNILVHVQKNDTKRPKSDKRYNGARHTCFSAISFDISVITIIINFSKNCSIKVVFNLLKKQLTSMATMSQSCKLGRSMNKMFKSLLEEIYKT